MMRTAGLILAAGKSTRFKGNTPKFLHPLLGKPIIDYVTDAVHPFVDELLYVSSPKHLVHPDAIIQDDPRGTGHAVMTALPKIKADKILIVFGDTPFISSETIKKMCTSKAEITIAAFKIGQLDQPYGRVDPVSKKITQYKDASETQKANPLCHAGIMMADYQVLADLLPRLSTDNQAQEYYLTDVVNMFDGEIGLVEGTEEEFMGIDNRQDLAEASTLLNEQLIKQCMTVGVTFQRPDSTVLAYDTTLGVDVEIGAHVVFGSNVTIESNTRILPFCYLENCHIKSHCVVGPFAHIRGGSELDEGAEIGNFVEVKKSTIGKKSKAKHHAYLGDAVIGEGVNIGAGTITCNYDGQRKSQTVIENGAFIGSNVNLIAPITVGAGAYIGAGSTVSKDVEPGTLVVERAEEKRKIRCDKN
jgi:bifunctional UDP-N-acetylglucosamine pyrophosphorylase/glucosamine-1-phosphate N-acetyltransferase